MENIRIVNNIITYNKDIVHLEKDIKRLLFITYFG